MTDYTYTHNIYFPNQLVDQPVTMLISLEPELMQAVQDEANRNGLFAEQFVVNVLRERLAPTVRALREQAERGE